MAIRDASLAVPPRCGACADPDRRAIKFGLMREARTAGGGHTTRGAGRLFLCEPCWRELTRGSARRGGSPPK